MPSPHASASASAQSSQQAQAPPRSALASSNQRAQPRVASQDLVLTRALLITFQPLTSAIRCCQCHSLVIMTASQRRQPQLLPAHTHMRRNEALKKRAAPPPPPAGRGRRRSRRRPAARTQPWTRRASTARAPKRSAAARKWSAS